MTFKGIVSYGPTTTPSYLENQSTFNNILASPLDGVVMEVVTNSDVVLSTDTWNPNRIFTIDDLSESLAALTARTQAEAQSNFNQTFGVNQVPAPAGFGKCDKNFVKLQISSPSGAVIDPFSNEFNVVYDKLVLLGQFAAQAGFYGVWFDVEGYIPVWTYDSMPQKASHTLEEYQDRYYDFGKALASDWRRLSSSLSVMTTDAYDGYAGELPVIAAGSWGLYKNFLDGFLDGWGYFYYNVYPGAGKVILTQEGMYSDKDTGHILRYGLGKINGTFDYAVPPPDQNYWGSSEYFFDSNIIEHGLALWIDYPGEAYNPAAPYWTGSEFKASLEAIIDCCDWAWIYNPYYSFYNGASGSLAAGIITKINEARIYAGLPNF